MQVVDGVQQRFLAAFVGAAVALDQAPAARQLQRQRGVARRRALHRAHPAFDQRLLLREALAAPALALQRRHQAQRQHARHRVRAQVQRQRPGVAAGRHAAPVPGLQALRQAGRQQRRELGHAGLEVVDQLQDLVVARRDLALHAREPAARQLQRRHLHDVVEGHPQRQPALHLVQRLGVGAGRLQARQALVVQAHVGGVLVGQQACARQCAQVGWRCGCQRRVHHRLLRPALLHGVEGQREAAQAGVGTLAALAAGADLRLEHVASERQQPAAGDGPQQHRADHRARLLRHARQVQQLGRTRVALQRGHQRRGVDAAVGLLHLLGHRQRTRGRADDQRALGRAHAVADLAHGLQQLRRHQQVDGAGHRVQAEHRAPVAQLLLPLREDLDVVRGGAGALRHAGDRRALRRVAGAHGGAVQPLGEHAAAFAAERADQDGDGLLRHVNPASGRSLG